MQIMARFWQDSGKISELKFERFSAKFLGQDLAEMWP
jgi:hypothetical protein